MKNMTEYEYKGFLICSYLKNSRNTKYWMVELNGKEVAADYSARFMGRRTGLMFTVAN
jgi:hypothetical protein